MWRRTRGSGSERLRGYAGEAIDASSIKSLDSRCSIPTPGAFHLRRTPCMDAHAATWMRCDMDDASPGGNRPDLKRTSSSRIYISMFDNRTQGRLVYTLYTACQGTAREASQASGICTLGALGLGITLLAPWTLHWCPGSNGRSSGWKSTRYVRCGEWYLFFAATFEPTWHTWSRAHYYYTLWHPNTQGALPAGGAAAASPAAGAPPASPAAASTKGGATSAAALAEYDQLLLAYLKPLASMQQVLAPEVGNPLGV